MQKIAKIIMLNNPEGVVGSSGKNITYGFKGALAKKLEFVDRFNGATIPGVIVEWSKSGAESCFVPMSSIKTIVLYDDADAESRGLLAKKGTKK